MIKCILQLRDASGMTLEAKIEEVKKLEPKLYGYEEELKTLFTKPLPIIKGVEVETACNANGAGSSYIKVTEFPQMILPEVQLAIMNIIERLGDTKLEIWGAGEPTDAMTKYFAYCMREYNVKYVALGQRPRVVTAGCDTVNLNKDSNVDGLGMARGGSCSVSMRTGLVVNMQKQGN